MSEDNDKPFCKHCQSENVEIIKEDYYTDMCIIVECKGCGEVTKLGIEMSYYVIEPEKEKTELEKKRESLRNQHRRREHFKSVAKKIKEKRKKSECDQE